MTRFALLSATAALAAVIVPSVAAAQVAPTSAFAPARETVRFADLNLNSPSDVRMLARRLDNTVDHVCGGQPTSASERGANSDYQACRSATMTATLKTINAPMLTATVEGRRLIQLAGR